MPSYLDKKITPRSKCDQSVQELSYGRNPDKGSKEPRNVKGWSRRKRQILGKRRKGGVKICREVGLVEDKISLARRPGNVKRGGKKQEKTEEQGNHIRKREGNKLVNKKTRSTGVGAPARFVAPLDSSGDGKKRLLLIETSKNGSWEEKPVKLCFQGKIARITGTRGRLNCRLYSMIKLGEKVCSCHTVGR